MIEKGCLKGQMVGYDDIGSWLAGLSLLDVSSSILSIRTFFAGFFMYE